MKIYDYHGKENVCKMFCYYWDEERYEWITVDPSNEMKPNVLYWVSTNEKYNKRRPGARYDLLMTDGEGILLCDKERFCNFRIRESWKHVMELKKDGMTEFEVMKLYVL